MHKYASVSSVFSKIVDLDKYDCMTSFLDTAWISRDHHASVFLSKTEVFHLRSMPWKVASVKKVFQSEIFE